MLIFIAGACSSDVKEPEKIIVTCPVNPSPVGSITDLTRSNIDCVNEFALELLKTTESKFPGNICLSPVSISAVISMLANGDDGEVRDELLTLLGFGNGSEGLAGLNNFNRVMLSNISYLDPATTCVFTNSYWHNPNMIIRDDFKNKIAESMFASVYAQTPSGEEGKEAINKFVETFTNGMIKNFIERPLNDITSAFINTIYFKGEWSEEFYKEKTIKNDFRNLNGSLSKVDFMYKEEFEYGETEDGTKAVRLPYGNGSFYMTAILPSDKFNHTPLLECLDNDNLTQLNGTFRKTYHHSLLFPKFESSNKADMIEVLKKMGLSKACDVRYGFNSIVEDGSDPVLKLFLHASKVIIDESGTEGAAASMAGMIDSASPDPVPLEPLVFNRPFIYLIQEKTSGIILFIGAVTDFS